MSPPSRSPPKRKSDQPSAHLPLPPVNGTRANIEPRGRDGRWVIRMENRCMGAIARWQMAANVTTLTGGSEPDARCRWDSMWRRSQTGQPFRILAPTSYPCPRPAAWSRWHQRRGLRPQSPNVRDWARWAGMARIGQIAVRRAPMVARRYDRPGLIGGRSGAVGLPVWYDSGTTFRSSRVGFGR